MTDNTITDYSNANMQYRNSVFCSYFNEPTRLLSLCNAILGTSYFDTNELEINTFAAYLILQNCLIILLMIGRNYIEKL